MGKRKTSMVSGHKENGNGALSGFSFARYRFVIKPLEPLMLPAYKGSTFRGGLGKVFRGLVCVRGGCECGDCILKLSCAYSYCFETPADGDGRARSSHWPHPYVLEPPLMKRCIYDEDEVLSFHLVLVGKGLDYLPYFIFVFEELGRAGIGRGKGRYRLERVDTGAEEVVYSRSSGKINEDHPTLRFADLSAEGVEDHARQITLRFVTPTRLVSGNHLTDEVDFRTFMLGLLRRTAALSQCHCGRAFDFRELLPGMEGVRTVHTELAWHDWERYSNRQERRMKLGGIIGTVTFEGELGPYMPFIRLGEYIHLGKQTSFGLGQYEVKAVS